MRPEDRFGGPELRLLQHKVYVQLTPSHSTIDKVPYRGQRGDSLFTTMLVGQHCCLSTTQIARVLRGGLGCRGTDPGQRPTALQAGLSPALLLQSDWP